MTSSARILTGLAAGVAVGLFFGEKAAVLEWAADGFVKLLQMTVLPYVTVSIVTSLGRLDYAQARGARGARRRRRRGALARRARVRVSDSAGVSDG